MIFQEIDMTPAQVSHKIRISFEGSWKTREEKTRIILKGPKIDFEKFWGFFDKACKGSPGMCWEGSIIILNLITIFI